MNLLKVFYLEGSICQAFKEWANIVEKKIGYSNLLLQIFSNVALTNRSYFYQYNRYFDLIKYEIIYII